MWDVKYLTGELSKGMKLSFISTMWDVKNEVDQIWAEAVKVLSRLCGM